MSDDVADVPSLQTLCIEAAASSDFWRVQTRHLEALREEHVNALVAEMIKRRRLVPTSLYKFRNTSLTEIAIDQPKDAHFGSWIGCISYLSHLRTVILRQNVSKSSWRQFSACSALAPSLQSLTIEGYGSSLKSLTQTLGSTISSLTALTKLRLAGYNSYSERMVAIDLKDLRPLSQLVNLTLYDIYIDHPEKMSSLVRLTNLKSISLKPGVGKEERYDYAPGVLYLGSVPKLEHFAIGGPCSCPPVASTLTSLVWTPSKIGHVHENAELAWIDMAPTLEKLCEFRFEYNFEKPTEIYNIMENIVSGAASSLTALHLDPESINSDGAFLSHCTKLKSLKIICSHFDSEYSQSTLSLHHLPSLTNLTHLELDHRVAGRSENSSLSAAVSIIRLLTNLEKLDLNPGDLRIMGELAREGVMQKLKRLSIIGEHEARMMCQPIHFIQNRIEVMADEDFTKDSTITQQPGLPSLKVLKTEYFACSLEVWNFLASLSPGVELLAIDGQPTQTYPGGNTLREISFQRYPDIIEMCDQVHMIAQSFPNLKGLEAVTWHIFGKSMYVLGIPQIAKARSMPVEKFDLPLEELQPALNRKTGLSVDDDVQNRLNSDYLGPLSAEILEYDERYRYSLEELLAVGEIWKSSVQGKEEMMKLRGQLTDDILFV